MNKFLKYLPPFFGVVFAVLLILTIKIMFQSPFFNSREETIKDEQRFHFAFFLPESDYSFFRNLKEGAESATESMNCSITFHSIDSDPVSLEMAPFSGLDGVAVYPYKNDEMMLKSLDNIVKAGIPIVQIENEILRNESTFFIGTNNFESGKAIGSLALNAKKDKLNIALIYSDKNPGLMSDDNLIEMGMLSVLGDRLASLETRKTSLNPLDAERLVYELMRKPDLPDIIVLTDPNDTLVTVQAIIDMNMVGEVQFIGFGDNESIKEYISKDLVLGTIVRNPYRIGYSAVMALKEICTVGYTSAYVDTGISIISEVDPEISSINGGDNE
ncbi:MAG: substrate-binding domain-containing protein [Spirochaetales bacterium]|nr:substrate-binding domain-containing protein [Spirochaetales bacterium]